MLHIELPGIILLLNNTPANNAESIVCPSHKYMYGFLLEFSGNTISPFQFSNYVSHFCIASEAPAQTPADRDLWVEVKG